MKPADEHNAPDAILALFDGTLAPAEADRVRAQIDADPALGQEAVVWRAMFADLHAIGDSIAGTAPEIDLWKAVESRLDTATEESISDDEITYDRLLDLVEGRLDPRAAATLRERIAGSVELQQEHAWLVSMRDSLGEYGDSISSVLPSVDLTPAIMHAVTSSDGATTTDDLFASLLDWRDGRLSLPESDRMRRLVDESEDVEAANAWLEQTADALETFGDGIVGHVPDIDVLDAVMDAVQRISEPDTIVTLDAERLRRRSLLRRAAALATAAMVTIGVGGVWFSQDEMPVAPKPNVSAPLATPSDWEQRQHELDTKRQSLPTRVKRRMINVAAVAPPTTLQTTEAPKLDADSVLEARREAAKTGDWTKFQQLATLSREQAIELAEKPGLSPGALVGLAESLNPDEAEKALLTVVGVLPGSPYVQLELLQSVAEQPPGEAQTEEPLAFSQKISELDPQNALPYYLEAKMYLDNGDPRSAIEALLAAQALEYATPYSLEAAAHRQSALIANGLEPETAELLAAFNAGNEEADALFDLAVALLDHGNYYNQIGDYNTAQYIFEGVQHLGDQIEAGAILSQEQLVALDIQSAAIDVLGQFYTAQGIVEALGPLTEQSLNIMGDLDSLSVFFGQLNVMLSDVMNPVFWNDVAGQILIQGDLAILEDYLVDWGLLPESP